MKETIFLKYVKENKEMFDIRDYLALDVSVTNHFDYMDSVDSKKRNVLSFCESETYLMKALENDNIIIIILTQELFDQYNGTFSKSIIVADDPKYTFWKLHNDLSIKGHLSPKMQFGTGENCSIHPSAEVSDKVLLGNNISIGAKCVVHDYTIIGDDTHIEAGAIIGCQGMQNCPTDEGKMHILHAGGVKIGRNVMIMSNAVVARAVYPDFTEVGDDTVISVLSSIGHASRIGKNCNIAGNVLIGGSAIIGDDVWIGPSAMIKDGISIGNSASVKLGSVVISDVAERATVSGNFAYDHNRHIRKYVGSLRNK
jgi:acyl-[acyl carrier protein]--UDP-N-acetylglucosamine O-acyltransferase